MDALAYATRDRDIDNGPSHNDKLIEWCAKQESPSEAFEDYKRQEEAMLRPGYVVDKFQRDLETYHRMLSKLRSYEIPDQHATPATLALLKAAYKTQIQQLRQVEKTPLPKKRAHEKI
jgi:hypothetical protein